jgi:hypothetical protein
MDLQKPGAPPAGDGCLVVAIRVPVRIVVLTLVVPVRMLWDALVAGGRLVNDAVFRPVGRALLWLARALFVWPFVALWRYVVVPLGQALAWLAKVLLVAPAVWVHRQLLAPLGHGVVWLLRGVGAVLAAIGTGLLGVLVRLVRYLVVVPARWLYTWVLAPVGRAVVWCAGGLAWLLGRVVTGVGFCLYWIARVLVVLPALALWRWVLVPVGRFLATGGREVLDALGHAWRIAGRISLAVGRFFAAVLRWTFVEPLHWVYRTVLTPLGHAVRDAVLRPAAAAARRVGEAVRQALVAARDSVRQTRADLRRALFGAPRRTRPVDRREPSGPGTRTLGSSTTALTKD